MIAAPLRSAPVQRSAAPTRASGANGGDADNAAALAALDNRIAALVARATTPDDEALERQRDAFDSVTRERAELERETEALRDLALQQTKFEDELLKKWIELV